MGTYGGVANDPDINKYSTSDIQDLTESGMGEGLRSAIIWIGIIVLIVVVSWLVMKVKKLLKSGTR